MKKYLLLIMLILFLPLNVSGADLYESSGINDSMNSIANENLYTIAPDFDFGNLVKTMQEGGGAVDLPYIVKKLLSLLIGEIYQSITIIGALLVLAVLCSMLTNMQAAFGHEGTAQVAFFACYAMMAGILITGFNSVAVFGASAVEEMVLTMQAAVPALTTLLIASGSIAAAPILQTVTLVAAQLCALLIKNVVLPVTYATLALKLINSLTENDSMARLASFGQKATKWIMGLMLTIFIGVLTISGFAANSVDSVGGKTAKYAIGSIIPVAGSALSDTVGLLASSAQLIKNAVGIAGVVMIILICAGALIKSFALMIIYNTAAAVLSPLCDKRFTTAVSSIAECIGMIFASIAVSAFLMIVSLAIMLSASGLSG